MKTIFDEINNPESVTCWIVTYNKGHGMLCILAYTNDGIRTHKDSFYIYFSSVVYFSGPMSWHGAHFQIGSEKDAREIVKRANYDESALEYALKLFTLDYNGFPVQILAHGAIISKEAPDWF